VAQPSGPLAGRRIVLGVTGGIAAYKAVDVCRRLVDAGAHVVPVLTNGARHMVGETTFNALASERVQSSLWNEADPIPHTRLGQTADLIVVCPATARVLGAFAAGISSDLLTATLIATRAPVVVCPAMHTEMWEHPAVQDNLATLVRRGTLVVPPAEGRLAGGDLGKGRLADPADIVAFCEGVLADRPWRGRTVVVSAGGTREPIDAVRYISNRSSGKQGYAVAAEAAERGAEVTLVSTVARPAPAGVAVVAVETAAQMHDAMRAHAAQADVVVMAAAVADFRPVAPAAGKIKKDRLAGEVPTVVLEQTADILADLGAHKPAGQVLVGFAAETSDLVANALAKLKRKNADMIVANDVAAENVGFEHDTNAATLLVADGRRLEVPLADKREVARALLDVVDELLAARAADGPRSVAP